jgi:transcriptional regulator with XRE-family HTH domain
VLGVAARRQSNTRLAYWRHRRGLSQAELRDRAGLSRATYARLEQGRYENPPLRYLTQLAILLEVDLMALIEDRWMDWHHLGNRKEPLPDDAAKVRSFKTRQRP